MTEKTIHEIAAELPPYPGIEDMMQSMTIEEKAEAIRAARNYADVAGKMTVDEFRASMYGDDNDALGRLFMAIHIVRRYAD